MKILNHIKTNDNNLRSWSRFLHERWGKACLIVSVTCVGLGASRAASMTDDFGSRPVASGSTVFFDGDSTQANPELGEPDHDGKRRRTVWAAWKAPGNGEVVIDTIGSSFDTVLAVYVGNSVTNLLPVARNQDLPDSTYSRVVFPTKNGVVYSIAVDGQHANASGYGAVQVNVNFTSLNQPGAEVGTDVFSNRPTLRSGVAALGTCNTRFFGLDVFEPTRVSNRDQTAWWRWVAPGNGAVVINTLGSDFDTVLTVYCGTNFETLSEVALSLDVPNGEQSQVSFQTLAGLEYQIMVDGQHQNASGYGNVILQLAWTGNDLPGAVPGANQFARRGQLEGAHAEGVAMNALFDTEAFEPDHGSTRDKTAWWEWTAPASGLVRIRTEGSDFDTHLVIYQGSSLSGLSFIAANDNVPNGLWSDVSFQARRGDSYLIMVDGRHANASGIGNIRVRVDQAVLPDETLAIYPAVEVEMPGTAGVRYQLKVSENFIDWVDVGEAVEGTGVPIRILDSLRGAKHKYYRYQIVP